MSIILQPLVQLNNKYSWDSSFAIEDRIKFFNWNLNLKDWSTSLKEVGPHCTFTVKIREFKMPNTRPKDIKFVVGMIVTHGDESTDCSAGVIIGWHRYEDRNSVNFRIEDKRFRSNILPLKICSNTMDNKQTHYLILTENNEMCYVGEDAITLITPKWIENREVGRYFDKFGGTHYVPNKLLEKQYPHDAAVTAVETATDFIP
ncbi:F-box only protein 21-like [Anoplolepis gracilipes]|uniref:F-box only protein 21-like n=1 Tax=Anoplolepis gracilipes TaxID=354296 RepID=UPI003BA348AC